MVKDDQERALLQVHNSEAGRRAGLPVHDWGFYTTAVTLVIGCLSGTGFMLGWLLPAAPASGGAASAPVAAKPASHLFFDWPRDQKPAVVLLLSGQQYGYIQPCGCSRPQLGGLERRYNFMRKLRTEKGWPVVAVDLGDIAQRNGPQALLKYKYSMESLKLLNYTAVGIGQNEMALPLLDALSEFALNNPSPRVLAANLLKKDVNFLSLVASWQVSATATAKVGVIGVVAASVAKEVHDSSVHFEAADQALAGALKEIQVKKPELLVLLFQGSEDEARKCAGKFPQLHVILCLTQEEEPSGKATVVGQTMIIGIGHKGRYVGLVGVFRTGKAGQPWSLHYQLAEMGEEYETPPRKDADNPVLAQLEEYTKEVKRNNLLAQYSKSLHPLQRVFPKATYVGSEACKKCHEYAYKVWKDSPHAHAYHTLEMAKRPSLRQYDGECVVCHVTGFEYRGGFTEETKTPLLKDNGCENCHGPGSQHVKGIKTPEMLKLMNPYKTPDQETPTAKTRRLLQLEQSCMKCHDTDNDVHWNFEKNWPKIVHMTPKDE